MLIVLLVACDWGSQPTVPVTPEVPVPTPVVAAPAVFPPAPRRGVAEVATPPEIARASEVVDRSAAGFVDVWFDADVLDFAGLGARLDGWGLTRTDGDGASWRVAAPEGGEVLLPRLLAAPGVADARMAVTTGVLPSGSVREGSERYGSLVHRWSIGAAGPDQQVTGGTVPAPAMPAALSSGVRSCLQPVFDDLQVGISAGFGWERAVSLRPSAWAAVFEDYGPCQARGFLVLKRDAPPTGVTVGGRAVADADDGFLQDLAVRWLGVRRSELDPAVMSAVAALAEAPDGVLARAVRDVAPSPVQLQLLAAFENRNPDGALALAGGSTSPTLRASAIGQDEELRRTVVTSPDASVSDLYAALAIWRPGPQDSPEMLDRFLHSRDPGVRARAWQARLETSEGLCRHQLSAAADLEGLAAVYRDCPQLDTRGEALARIQKQDPARALALVSATLEDPETESAGIAAVAAARKLDRMDLLAALVDRTTVSRGIRAFALAELEKANSPRFGALAAAHGAYLGAAVPPDPAAATAQDEE